MAEDKKKIWPHAPDPKELCSPELYAFLRTHHKIFDFFFFGTFLAARSDEVRMTAAKALAASGDEKDLQGLREAELNPNPAFEKLQRFSALQGQNMCIRACDNFSTYLSEMVQSVLKKRPEILKSGDMIKAEDILRFSNYRDLVEYLVNKKVNELAYKSITDFEKFLVERTGLTFSENEEDRVNMMFGVELRNIFSHSRGKVSETTLKRLKHFEHGRPLKLGQVFHAEFDEIVAISNSLVNIARDLDEKFCRKFRIRRRRYSTFVESNKSARKAVA